MGGLPVGGADRNDYLVASWPHWVDTYPSTYAVVASEDGTTVSLLDQPACEGSDVDAFFLDEAVPVGNDQCLRGRSAAILGEVAPLRPLAPLLGAAPGPLTLRVTDLAPGEAGQVLRWCVRLTR